MSPLLFIGVAVAGGFGAALRFLLDRAVLARTRGSYPWGITTVNLTGSFLLGALTGATQSLTVSPPWVAILGVGLLGGYTTFSAVAVEAALALERRDYRGAALRGGAQLVVAVILAALGLAVGAVLTTAF
ncbi:fluoride efflux transporter FluC [Micromonospora sp. DT81.3]|uniref:fluoride efflux transporter FluC n=1 Tax=Micromonospora sp. DT81.3 TaxID=3416523 RepID=UPI003CFA215A